MGIFDSFSNLVNNFNTVFQPSSFVISSDNNEVIVNEKSVSSIAAYSAGVNAIANSIASIPFKLRKDKQLLKNDLYFLIKEKPNKYCTSFQFFRFMINQMLYRGTAIAKIIRDSQTGEPIELIPVDFSEIKEAKIAEGELYYIINNIPYHNDDLLIFKLTGGLIFGLDPISQFAETLGLSLSSTRYAKKAFEGDGSNIKGVITSEHKLKEEQKENFRTSIQKNYTGSNSKSLLVLDNGFKFDPVSLSPDQLKIIETRNIQVAEIARILNLPIYIIASELTGSYNSIEAQQLDFYKRTLAPIIYMIENELKHKLLNSKQIKSDHFFKGSIETLLRGSSKERTEYYKELFYLGVVSSEWIRGKEDINDDVNDDDKYIQLNLIPKSIHKDFYDAKIDQEYNKIKKENE